jgi:predicted nucleic acid-binding protein
MLAEVSTAADLGAAMRAVGEHRLAFRDAMLWATARRTGVRILISEDFRMAGCSTGSDLSVWDF